ncbi:MAG: orotidine-5'-phosphate decarboxylase, partial [Rhodothermales bacterium]|nr:orotidine-5'-phosphate decarboxylase [Rhodothermales bacterium]
AFVLGRTSNPDADEIQEWPSSEKPLFGRVAELVSQWAVGQPGTVGLVAGATDVEGLRRLRLGCPAMPFLIPGIGAQGGQLDAVLEAAHSPTGRVIVNSSRGIIYASSESDFAAAARQAAKTLREEVAGQLAPKA